MFSAEVLIKKVSNLNRRNNFYVSRFLLRMSDFEILLDKIFKTARKLKTQNGKIQNPECGHFLNTDVGNKNACQMITFDILQGNCL